MWPLTIYISLYICGPLLPYKCPHTTIFLSTYMYISLCIYVASYYISLYIYVAPHTTLSVSPSYYIYVFLSLCYICVLALLDVCAYYYICVLILLDMCPHTTTYVSAYYYRCVLILLYMCPHTTTHASSYNYIYVLILLHRRAQCTPQHCTSKY